MADKIRLGLIGASVRTIGYPFVLQLGGADLVRSTC
jgi:hypothetical protein